jgi:hypothetical protein
MTRDSEWMRIKRIKYVLHIFVKQKHSDTFEKGTIKRTVEYDAWEKYGEFNDGVRHKLLSTNHNGLSHRQKVDAEGYYKW